MLKFKTQLYLMLPNILCKLLQTAHCALRFLLDTQSELQSETEESCGDLEFNWL